MSKEKKLKKIKKEVINCKKCSLYKTRTLPVIGQGNHNTDIILIGEAPGANEDKTGIPFCGKSGDFLDEMLNRAGIKREDVYICNLLKCRPPKNRDPNSKELKACTPYLDRQIELIKPKVISSLGRYSMEFLMKKYGLDEQLDKISNIHGQVFDVKSLNLKLVPLYHPAVAVYNANMKDTLIEDFKILKDI